MTAVLFVAAAFALGLFLGALVSVARDYYDEQAAQDAERDELVAQWRQGHDYGKEMGYRDGWTSGRLALVDEQQARRMHPTGSPLSDLKALDAEADRRMKGGD
jgi:hypothetical protein